MAEAYNLREAVHPFKKRLVLQDSRGNTSKDPSSKKGIKKMVAKQDTQTVCAKLCNMQLVSVNTLETWRGEFRIKQFQARSQTPQPVYRIGRNNDYIPTYNKNGNKFRK